jgi:hypothetical protein
MNANYRRLLRVFSVSLGVAYLLALPASPYAASPVIKGLCIALLAALAVASRRTWLALALAASSAGDVLLDLDPERLFVAGLCLFLAAPILYTVLFARNQAGGTGAMRGYLLGIVLAYAFAVSIWIVPGTAEDSGHYLHLRHPGDDCDVAAFPVRLACRRRRASVSGFRLAARHRQIQSAISRAGLPGLEHLLRRAVPDRDRRSRMIRW